MQKWRLGRTQWRTSGNPETPHGRGHWEAACPMAAPLQTRQHISFENNKIKHYPLKILRANIFGPNRVSYQDPNGRA